MARIGRPPSPVPTKQIGIRLPIDLWTRVHVVAAASGTGPGGYVKGLIEASIDRDERALADALAARGVTPTTGSKPGRKSR